MHIKIYQLDLNAQQYHELIVKTVLGNMIYSKATLISTYQFFIQFCSLLEDKQVT